MRTEELAANREPKLEQANARTPRDGANVNAALASEASGQRGKSTDARAGHSPEAGSSARATRRKPHAGVEAMNRRLSRRHLSAVAARRSCNTVAV
jgi:hypothetical protein